ncbi:metallophosphoesterase [Rhizobium sp. TH2]|uniref:metallophosphoesterase family protein n=1 Tax=Rhizobium sp. TH2 TaxID=2775403 RepID=UPI002157CE29|nr:metallophosphoesterase [Rhizobium sp. TH2]UVC06987.1 metallophosphoesterase [Rhizobium sp. TH2]
MKPPSHPPIAIIADAHFHDLEGDYGIASIQAAGRKLAMRPFTQVSRSTRVFNESTAALRTALDDIAVRGIHDVVLLGDYSDDGQVTTLAGLRKLLDGYSARYGMRFYATPGNHDIFADHGRHRAKGFANASGGHDLVTSDPERGRGEDDDSVIVWSGMRCMGYPEGLLALPDIGFFGVPGATLWETPFGIDSDPAARRYRVRSVGGATRELMDGSYLVEPFEGVWMLMIDANVFAPLDEPRDGHGFADSTDAGWNGMLHHKAFILDWMKDVSRRAREQGRTLLAFSHYPALDPLDGTRDDELVLLGETGMVRRVPDAEVGDTLIDTGIQVHFSGHVHVNDTASRQTASGFLVNISVPSLVAFPAAYKIVTVRNRLVEIESVGIGRMSLDTDLMAEYRRQAMRAGVETGGMLEVENYGEFLHAHLGHLVSRRHLKREWPEALAKSMRTMSLGDLARYAGAGSDAALENLDGITALDFLRDCYRVRMGSAFGVEAVGPVRLAVYEQVANRYRSLAEGMRSGPVESFRLLFKMYDRYLSGLPSRDFVIDLETGAITER